MNCFFAKLRFERNKDTKKFNAKTQRHKEGQDKIDSLSYLVIVVTEDVTGEMRIKLTKLPWNQQISSYFFSLCLCVFALNFFGVELCYCM